MISTRDSFSKLISLICNDAFTTIGIYYPVSLNGGDFICVNLYNIWENSEPAWIEYFMEEKSYSGHINLDDIIRYHLVDKVITYPIKAEYRNRFKIFFSKIIANEKNIKNDNSFEWLLSYVTDTPIIGRDATIRKDVTTGYDLVNYIIKMLDNYSCSRPSGTMKLVTPNPLSYPKRQNNIVGTKSIEKINQSPIFVKRLDRLIDTFKGMYNSSDIFQTKLIELKHGEMLSSYISNEDDLYERMKKGLSCKDSIENLNKIRDKVSAKPLKEKDCYDDKREEMAKELSNFRSDLIKIIDDVKRGTTPVVIYLDKLLSHYNNTCEILGLTSLDIPSEIPSTSAIITTDQSIIVNLDSNYITVNVSRLDRYNKEELREILKTINEITIADSKYISLQNSIVQELSSRI